MFNLGYLRLLVSIRCEQAEAELETLVSAQKMFRTASQQTIWGSNTAEYIYRTLVSCSFTINKQLSIVQDVMTGPISRPCCVKQFILTNQQAKDLPNMMFFISIMYYSLNCSIFIILLIHSLQIYRYSVCILFLL